MISAVLAILVALNILREAWSLLRRSVQGLMDHALSDDERARIDAVLRELLDLAVRLRRSTADQAALPR